MRIWSLEGRFLLEYREWFRCLLCMRTLLTLIFGVAIGFQSACGREGNPIEVGDVVWGRDYDAAAKASRASGKPIFALFQEVPG